MTDKKILTANLTIAFAVLLISLLSKNFYFGFVSLLIIYALLVDIKIILKFFLEIFKFIEQVGKFILSTLLFLVYFIFITPYAVIVRIFSKNKKSQSTWSQNTYDYKKLSYFKQPW